MEKKNPRKIKLYNDKKKIIKPKKFILTHFIFLENEKTLPATEYYRDDNIIFSMFSRTLVDGHTRTAAHCRATGLLFRSSSSSSGNSSSSSLVVVPYESYYFSCGARTRRRRGAGAAKTTANCRRDPAFDWPGPPRVPSVGDLL